MDAVAPPSRIESPAPHRSSESSQGRGADRAAEDAGSDAGIADRLSARIGRRQYAMWFERSAKLRLDDKGEAVRVAVPNRFVADWIERHFESDVAAAAGASAGRDVRVEIDVDPGAFSRQDSVASGGVEPQDASDKQARRAKSKRRHPTDTAALLARRGLRHRLEQFVTGPSNELAHAATCRLADEAVAGARSHAPLFLHGGCGLGKTHLLQGACRRVLEQTPDAGVLYLTGEQFTNDYITAVRTGKLDDFRRRMRSLELLALDDLHFLSNKSATQQEFLHSFDQIDLGGARVILASDSHPRLIDKFSEQLVSRCVQGLVVQVSRPDADTRRRLVAAMARRRGLVLEPVAEALLASEVGSDGSVREIEGLLTKLHALITLAGDHEATAQPVGRHWVDRLMHGEHRSTTRRRVHYEHIVAVVTQELGVTEAQLAGRGRHSQVVLARAVLIRLCRELTTMSFPEIARAMGKSNHSTVITADQRLKRQIDEGLTARLAGHDESMPIADLLDRFRRSVTRG
ncbi:MAG: DnaA/Hda family protein [Planctomycetota bacterium]